MQDVKFNVARLQHESLSLHKTQNLVEDEWSGGWLTHNPWDMRWIRYKERF